MRKVIVIGAGGQSKVLCDIIRKSGDCILGILDDNKKIGTDIFDTKVIGKVCDMKNFADAEFIIAIGDNYCRKNISTANVKYYTAIHPTAVIGVDAKIGEGSCICAFANVGPSATVGKHCIINTGSIVEHDNIISDFVHISPGAVLGGTVQVGECSHIGLGAKIKNNISITKDCVIGVGGVVVKDIAQSGTYIGVPVRKLV